MIIILRIIRAIFGLIAGSILTYFLLVPASRVSPVMEDRALELMPHVPVFIFGLLAFVLVREYIHYLHKKKYGVPHPKLESLWHI